MTILVEALIRDLLKLIIAQQQVAAETVILSASPTTFLSHWREVDFFVTIFRIFLFFICIGIVFELGYFCVNIV